MRLTALSVTSKSCSSWRAVSVGDAVWLLPAVARDAPLGAGVSLGDSSAPADYRS